MASAKQRRARDYLGDLMKKKNVTSGNGTVWVDIFPERVFGGRLTRLLGSSESNTLTHKGKNLPQIRSIIVGPDTIVEITPSGDSECVRLSQRTVLADVSQLTNGAKIQSVRVISAST